MFILRLNGKGSMLNGFAASSEYHHSDAWALPVIEVDVTVVGPGLQSKQVDRPVMDKKAH